MKKILMLLLVIAVITTHFGCGQVAESVDIVTTTAPLFTFTTALCAGTDLSVDCLITENVSCLHDYTLQTSQMRAIEDSELVVISGAGLEEAFADILNMHKNLVDTSESIQLLCQETEHDHEAHQENAGHHHAEDPHIWLSPQNAVIIVNNISVALASKYPQWEATFEENRTALLGRLDALSAYATEQLAELTTREIITFHDGFGYMAESFDLKILHAIEEESGREASAQELIHLCELVTEHHLPCIFIEKNGSVSAADVVAAETGIDIYSLDMAMSGDYFDAMYHNIDILKEALR